MADPPRFLHGRSGPAAQLALSQSRRRAELLARQVRPPQSLASSSLSLTRLQRSARQELVERSRRLAAEALAPVPADTEPEPAAEAPPEVPMGDAGAKPGRRLRQRPPPPLMLAEWLLELPGDLATAWLVAARPAGQACLLTAARGSTVLRASDDGRLLASFPSPLPGGGAARQAANGSCVLDCILAAGGGVYVTDALAWRGVDLAGLDTECRLFLLASRLAEAGDGAGTIQPLAWAPADAAGLRQAYAAACAGGDGLLLLHKEALYCSGPSALRLRWKDGQCSPYGVAPGAGQQLVLRAMPYDARLVAATEEGTPLAEVPPGVAEGQLLSYELAPGPAGLLLSAEGALAAPGVRCLGSATRRGGRADAGSKVAFLHALRHGGALGIDALLAAAGVMSEPTFS